MNLNLHDFMADACVNLVKIIDACGTDNLLQKREDLIKEGFNYTSTVETMWNSGDAFVSSTAQEFHDNIYSKLQSLSDPV